MDEAYKKAVFPDACLSRCASPENCVCKEKVQAALKEAHEIRRFEIDLYWRRSLYFWGFQAAFFAAYALIFDVSIDKSDNLKNQLSGFTPAVAFAIALLGLIVSILWYFLERGSKAWQENWEHHIDQLEDEFTGRLYKTVLGEAKEFYSVTRINKLFIVAIGLAWMFFLALPLYSFGFLFSLVTFSVAFLSVCFLDSFLARYDNTSSVFRIKSGFPKCKHRVNGKTEIGDGVKVYYRWEPLRENVFYNSRSDKED